MHASGLVPMEQESPTTVTAAYRQPYDFHDERFITWWLNSLYLFAPEDQLAIAQLLRAEVHAPEAAHEIEAFLTVRAQALGTGDGHLEAPSLRGGRAGTDTATGILGSLSKLWRISPWMAGLGLCALALFLVKGVWFVLREVIRVIV